MVDTVAEGKVAEYFSPMRYLKGHERHCNLLGREAVNVSKIPTRAEIKELPAALY
jgi:hypothetical protein